MAHLHHYTEPDDTALPTESVDINIVFGDDEQELAKEEEEAEELLKHQNDLLDGDHLVDEENDESQVPSTPTPTTATATSPIEEAEVKTPTTSAKKGRKLQVKEQLVKLHDLLEKAETYTNFLIEDGLMTDAEAIMKSREAEDEEDEEEDDQSVLNANNKRPRENGADEKPKVCVFRFSLFFESIIY
jgi:hypothetical protein